MNRARTGPVKVGVGGHVSLAPPLAAPGTLAAGTSTNGGWAMEILIAIETAIVLYLVLCV